MKKYTKEASGFTLIEVIVYIGLFSLLVGTGFLVAFQLIDGSSDISAKATTEEEGNFVMQKVVWALTGVKSLTTPVSGSASELKITKYDGPGGENKIRICLDGDKIKIREGSFLGVCSDVEYLPLTTDNVAVSNLQFEHLDSPGGSPPEGTKATTTIDGVNFVVTKYFR